VGPIHVQPASPQKRNNRFSSLGRWADGKHFPSGNRFPIPVRAETSMISNGISLFILEKGTYAIYYEIRFEL
jgi:hypothetical protein